MAKKVLTDITATGSVTASKGLTLTGANSPITLNGSLGIGGQLLRSTGAGTTPTWVNPTLSTAYMASTTSAQLAGVMSDETGSGALVFGTSPSLTTPRIANSSGTVASGLMDYNGEIFTLTTTGTSAGKGTILSPAWAYSNANATAATTNTSQSIFQAGARALTLEAGKTYYFRLSLGFTVAFPAGSPFAVQFVPTFSQTPVAINYTAQCFGATTVNNYRITSASATTVSPTYFGAASNQNLFIEGFFQSNGTTGGTIEFKYQLSLSNPGGSATMNTGCFQQIMKIGSGAPGIISGAWA